MLQALTEDVVKSSEIEGEILDREQVRSSIARRLGMDIGGLTPADRHVEGVVEMMLDATQKLRRAADRGASVRLACRTVSDGTQRHGQITVGAWRDDNRPDAGRLRARSAVSTFITRRRPPSGSTRKCSASLSGSTASKRIDPVLKAGDRPSLVRDHPSVRGRQRPHRARDRRPGAGALREQRAALLQHVGADPAGAQSLLRHARSNAEERPRHHALAEWFLGCLDRAFDGAEETLAAVLTKARFWESMRTRRSTTGSA